MSRNMHHTMRTRELVRYSQMDDSSGPQHQRPAQLERRHRALQRQLLWPDVLRPSRRAVAPAGREGREPGKPLDRDSSPLELYTSAAAADGRRTTSTTTHGVFSACRERGGEERFGEERFLFRRVGCGAVAFFLWKCRGEGKRPARARPRARRGSLQWRDPASEWHVCYVCVCVVGEEKPEERLLKSL